MYFISTAEHVYICNVHLCLFVTFNNNFKYFNSYVYYVQQTQMTLFNVQKECHMPLSLAVGIFRDVMRAIKRIGI